MEIQGRLSISHLDLCYFIIVVILENLSINQLNKSEWIILHYVST